MDRDRVNEALIVNAKDALSVGFEDYIKHKDLPKRIKSSVRNIYSGIELLLKSYVNSLSPVKSNNFFLCRKYDFSIEGDVIIATGIVKGDTIGLCEIEKTVRGHYGDDKNRKICLEILESARKIKRIRNQLEHSYSADPLHILKFSIFDSFTCINKIDQIMKSTICDEIIPDEFKAEFAKREESFKRITQNYSGKNENVKYILCTNCSSFMLQFGVNILTDEIACVDCGNKFTMNKLLNNLCGSETFRDTHVCLTKLQFFHEKVFSILNNDKMVQFVTAILDNSQIIGISEDQDIHDFLNKIYINLLNRNDGDRFKKFIDRLSSILI